MDSPHHLEPILDAPLYDAGKAIEIAERIWWVGSYLEGDVFQCHSYLIENGTQSALIDPGSPLTFAETRRKIETIVPFEYIRYFICQHQDPDIVAAVTLFDGEVVRDDAHIVTHWRTEMLIRHYGWRLPIRNLDDCDWVLRLGHRVLRFVPIPYLHFPGAICTFDEHSGVLFSSDLFGAFTSDFNLFARDDSYFEAMRPFHEHYMPSREILQSGLLEIQRHPVRMIAPQHGSIIPEHLVGPMIEKLKSLDCGLLASAPGRMDLARLSRLNGALKELGTTVTSHGSLNEIVRAMLGVIRKVVPELDDVEFWAIGGDGQPENFSERSHFRPWRTRVPLAVTELLGTNADAWSYQTPSGYRLVEVEEGNHALVMPLAADASAAIGFVLVLHLDAFPTEMQELREIVRAIGQPLRIGVEREQLIHGLEQDKHRYYLQAIRDPLTGLFTRVYMNDAVVRMIERHARNHDAGFGLVLFDIDGFKPINDAWGHRLGDEVLRRTAERILAECRKSDISVRFGGDEIAVFLADTGHAEGLAFAERVRLGVGQLHFEDMPLEMAVTLSAGFAEHLVGESFEHFLDRADHALYCAKRAGRNRVSCATGGGSG